MRSRLTAHRLVREICTSLANESDAWALEADAHGHPVLTRDAFGLRVVPRAVRLCDAIHLHCDGTEVWLPLLSRLRLRNAVRAYLLGVASERWSAKR